MASMLLVATGNPGKLKELKRLLLDTGLNIISPADINMTADIKETGATFEENARLKAVNLARKSGLLTLADDSGLEVDALDGKPGVLSARFAGKNASDHQRNMLLLSRLKGVPEERRTARFRCVIAIATPDGNLRMCSGSCEGIIALQPAGENNFGYDPVFFLPELGKTMAQLSIEVKNKYSHRSKAIDAAKNILHEMMSC